MSLLDFWLGPPVGVASRLEIKVEKIRDNSTSIGEEFERRRTRRGMRNGVGEDWDGR